MATSGSSTSLQAYGHPIVKPRRVHEKFELSQQPPVSAIRNWIKDAHLDGRIGREPQDLLIPCFRVAVIDEQADAHAAICGMTQPVGQHTTRLVAPKNID